AARCSRFSTSAGVSRFRAVSRSASTSRAAVTSISMAWSKTWTISVSADRERLATTTHPCRAASSADIGTAYCRPCALQSRQNAPRAFSALNASTLSVSWSSLSRSGTRVTTRRTNLMSVRAASAFAAPLSNESLPAPLGPTTATKTPSGNAHPLAPDGKDARRPAGRASDPHQVGTPADLDAAAIRKPGGVRRVGGDEAHRVRQIGLPALGQQECGLHQAEGDIVGGEDVESVAAQEV